MPDFYVVPTEAGSAKMADAMSLGKPFNLTHMAVGDGGGVLPVPDRTRRALIGEKRRDAINVLSPDRDSPGQYIAEQVLPPNVGGWWVRELGLFDEDGTLCYYGNCPETYKPLLQEGSARTQTVRMVIVPSEGLRLELKIDPNIVLATRQYVDGHAAKLLPRSEATAAGIGADLASTNAAKGDLNALVTPGEYFYARGTNRNAPSSAGVMKVWRENDQRVFQMGQSREGELFLRSRSADGTWSAWRWHAGLTSDRVSQGGVGAAIDAGSRNELSTPAMQLTRGIYLLWPYNCGFEVTNDAGSYYLTCRARFDRGSGETGFVNVPQVGAGVYHLAPFLVRVFSETATVRFVLINNGSNPPGRGTVRIRGGNINGFAFYGNKIF